MDRNEHTLLNTDEFLAARDVVELLRISRSGFWKMVRDGRLPGPSLKIGNMPRWSKREVIARFQVNS